ncbi:OVARIAN TUMOR DOMAIN-containing deubiquitinating enzyme 10-like [Cotesia glomerata]|nr:OVARIAN TUMOR DOMAIN-containing deubiquitinating enzyme 10-like [Cotesia glomerata]
MVNCTDRLRSPEGTFTVHKIYGDGNCMFRAISLILWETEEEHRSLRTLVVHHIMDHWRDYAPYVLAEWGISRPEDYLDYMKHEGVFASELECIVATKIYGLDLSIYRRVNEVDVKRVFYNRVDPSRGTARLLFTGRSDSGHYDVLYLDP